MDSKNEIFRVYLEHYLKCGYSVEDAKAMAIKETEDSVQELAVD